MSSKKETFYFSHDYNSRNDPKMIRLFMKDGIAGFGIYWCIVEMLYEQGGYIDLIECERIAFELRTQVELIKSVIDSDLFGKNEKMFWSESVIRRLNERKIKSAKARESARLSWPRATAQRTHTDSNAIKERKGKEIKGNKKNTDDFFEEKIQIAGTRFEGNLIFFEDGSSQELTLSQQSLLSMDELKPSDCKKLKSTTTENVLRQTI